MKIMQIIPAIDLKEGRCVRLYQGDPHRETVYGNDPQAVARRWVEEGATLLHIVDLDGAFAGASANASIIAAIAAEVPVPLQCGGGLRSAAAVERAFEAGVSRLILGTMALEEPDEARRLVRLYDGKILVGIDARRGVVALRGWQELSAMPTVELALRVEQWGVREIVYTDISRDGTLEGPDLAGLEEILEATGLQVIVSGGVSSPGDLRLLQCFRDRVPGVIVGKALYAGHLTMEEAREALA